RLDPVHEPRLRFEADIEQGLAWCESTLLADVAPEVERADRRSLETLITHLLADADAEVGRLESYFQRIEFAAGDNLISEGTPSDDIFFIESGRASVIMNGIEGPFHLAYVEAGAVVGELAFYLARPRTASVIADRAVAAWRLARADLKRLETDSPAL